MALDKAGWEGGTGAHSQTDAATGDQDQFIVARTLLSSLAAPTAVTAGDGMTNVYASGDQVGDTEIDPPLSAPAVLGLDRIMVLDPESVLNPDNMEIWCIFGAGVPPTLPGDHSTLISASDWVTPALFVIPAGGYDTTVVGGPNGGNLHQKAFPHVVAFIPSISAIAIRTTAITTAGYTTTTGPTLFFAGAQAVLPS